MNTKAEDAAGLYKMINRLYGRKFKKLQHANREDTVQDIILKVLEHDKDFFDLSVEHQVERVKSRARVIFRSIKRAEANRIHAEEEYCVRNNRFATEDELPLDLR